MHFKTKLFLCIVLLASLVLAMAIMLSDRDDPTQKVMAILGHTPESFLSTTRSDQMNIARVDDSGWLFGAREGISTMRITSHAGVDLRKLGPQDIRSEAGRVHVRLPDCEVLAVEADLDSYRAVHKTSGLNHIRDAIRGKSVKDELMEHTKESIPSYRDPANYPARKEIVDRMNRESSSLFAPAGLEVQFE